MTIPTIREPDGPWMTLGQASRFLGVDASTLRTWADSGRIPTFRTPGGHRRFSSVDLVAFLQRGKQRPDRQIGSLLGPHGAALMAETAGQQVRAQDWYAAFDPKTTEAMRRTCRRLMEGLVGFLTGGRRQGVFLREGGRVGRALGTHVATIGLSPAAATRAFLFFRAMVTDSVSRKLPLSPEGKVRSMRRIDTYLNGVLAQMMEAYQQRQLSERGRAATPGRLPGGRGSEGKRD